MRGEMTSGRQQVISVGNYVMTGRTLGKGHFARVEEATHKVIGKKVAIKIIDLTVIKEQYAQRNLHREPRLMARLRHPCIAALYETMIHEPRLYLVMELAGGGDLYTYVMSKGGARGITEGRARGIAAQLVSAVRHMHDRGVIHRDLKMENIMLDTTKQFIKIVDFGLSNLWHTGGALRTPCGSLEYAAPELFVNGCKYGPQVDLWSIGVIVYAMVTGGLPFRVNNTRDEVRDRPLLQQMISKGCGKKQRAALTCVSDECKMFIQYLLEPDVNLRMKIDEAARNRWIRRPGMTMKMHPFSSLDPKPLREIYKEISELFKESPSELVDRIKSDPFGDLGGVYNMRTHECQLQSLSVNELLWTSTAQENRPASPLQYFKKCDPKNLPRKSPSPLKVPFEKCPKDLRKIRTAPMPDRITSNNLQRLSVGRATADCGDTKVNELPKIEEHSNAYNLAIKYKDPIKSRTPAKPSSTRRSLDLKCNSTPKANERVSDIYKTGDGLPYWRSSMSPSTRILYSNTSAKRASLGNITSPHSSTKSCNCKSERAMPVDWSLKVNRDEPYIHKYRRNTPTK